MANTVRVGITAADEGFKSTLNQMEQSSNKFASSLSKSGKQANTFNGQLRSLRKQAVELAYAYDQLDEQAKNSDFGQSMKAQLQDVLNTAGQMQDIKGDVAEEIKNIASDTRTWDGMKEGIGVVSSSLQGLASIYGMLGGDTKAFAKALVAVNAVQSVSNTIIGIGNALQKQSALMVMLRTAKSKLFSASLATENTALAANATANVADAAATSTATAATWSFNAALAANPIGAVIVAVAALAAGIYALTQIIQKATPEEEGLAEATTLANDAALKGYEAYKKNELELKQLQQRVNSFNGTKAEEKKLVEELNQKYGEALGRYKDLDSWKAALSSTTMYYCRVLQAEAKVQALNAAAATAYAKAMAGEDFSKNMSTYKALSAMAEEAMDDVIFYNRQLEISKKLHGSMPKSSGSSKSSKSSTKSTKEEKTALEQLDEQIKKHEKELASLDKSEGKNIETINKLKSTIASLRKQKLAYIDTKSLSGLKDYKKELSEIRKLYDEHSDEYKNVNAQIDTINNKMLTVIETMSQSDNIEILSEAQSSLDELTKSLDVTSDAFQRAAKDARDLNYKIEDINQIRNNSLSGIQKGSIAWLEQDLEKAKRRLDEWLNNNSAKFALTLDEEAEKEALQQAVKDAEAELGNARIMMKAHLEPDDIDDIEGVGTSLNIRPIDLTFDYKRDALEKVEHRIDYIKDKIEILKDIKLEDVGEEIFNQAQQQLKDFRKELKDLEKEKIKLEVDADYKEASKELNIAGWETFKGTGSDLSDMYSSIKGIGEAFNDAKDPVEAFFKAFDSVTSVVDNILDLIDLYKELNAAITAFNAVKEAETALTVKNAAMKTVENEQQSETLVQKQTEATIMQENAAALGEQAAATTALNIVKETSNVLSEKSAGAQAAESVALGTSTSAIGAQAAAETAALAPKEAAVQVNQQLAVAAMDMAAANIAAAHSEIPFVGPALAAAGIATVTAATVSAHGAMVGLQAFAQGGIVKGSTTMGDSTLIRVNSGEMVINKIQQANLFKLLNNGSVSGNNNVSVDGSVRIKGSDLQIALSNYKKITGKTV